MTAKAAPRPTRAARRAPRRWLVKEEPSHYAYRDLERDGHTGWNSVHNPLAQKNLRSMLPGDPVFFYHSGTERVIAGIAEVSSSPHLDPADARGAWTVEIRAVRALSNPVTLLRLKTDPQFLASPLVRIGRLSVVEITPAQWERVLAMESATGP